MEIKNFKIKNKEGKFSKGGCNPIWTSRGKTWTDLSSLKRSLRQHCKTYSSGVDENGSYKFLNGWWNNIPEDWIVIELSTNGIKEYSAKDLYPPTTGVKL